MCSKFLETLNIPSGTELARSLKVTILSKNILFKWILMHTCVLLLCATLRHIILYLCKPWLSHSIFLLDSMNMTNKKCSMLHWTQCSKRRIPTQYNFQGRTSIKHGTIRPSTYCYIVSNSRDSICTRPSAIYTMHCWIAPDSDVYTVLYEYSFLHSQLLKEWLHDLVKI